MSRIVLVRIILPMYALYYVRVIISWHVLNIAQCISTKFHKCSVFRIQMQHKISKLSRSILSIRNNRDIKKMEIILYYTGLLIFSKLFTGIYNNIHKSLFLKILKHRNIIIQKDLIGFIYQVYKLSRRLQASIYWFILFFVYPLSYTS